MRFCLAWMYQVNIHIRTGVFPSDDLPTYAKDAIPNMPATIPVLIVDSSDVVRAGLSGVLGSSDGIDIVGETANAHEAVSLARDMQPQVIILDLGPSDSPRTSSRTSAGPCCD